MAKRWEFLGDEVGKKRNLQKHPQYEGYYCTLEMKTMAPDQYYPSPPTSQNITYNGDVAGRDINKNSNVTSRDKNNLKDKIYVIIAGIVATVVGGVVLHWMLT